LASCGRAGALTPHLKNKMASLSRLAILFRFEGCLLTAPR
jgi:hypothetical protein